MSALSIVLALFVLFYLLPGSIFLSNAIGNKGKRLENVGLAVLLSVVVAPLTLTLFSREGLAALGLIGGRCRISASQHIAGV